MRRAQKNVFNKSNGEIKKIGQSQKVGQNWNTFFGGNKYTYILIIFWHYNRPA